MSATPSVFEAQHAPLPIEQIIRPTGLPIRSLMSETEGQIEDLLTEIKATVGRENRVLVTTLTTRMAEELAEYLANHGIRVRYLHSEIDTFERTEILRDLRLGKFDCLVGINLLREGLDIPEVELVAILDADKEGFLRNERSLIQTIGRAARNERGHVILYASKETDSMKRAISETPAAALSRKHTTRNTDYPTFKKNIAERLSLEGDLKEIYKDVDNVAEAIIEMEKAMAIAAENLDFERAIELRDQVGALRKKHNLPDNEML